MKKRTDLVLVFAVVVGILSALVSTRAQALELDWSGQFRSEFNFVHNYSMDNSDAGSNNDLATRNPAPGGNVPGGYYVPGGGQNDATWETLFLKIKPKLVVNDNVYIKSEWWLGDPTFGFFGNAAPYSIDQHQYYSTQSRGSYITAQRFWAEFLTDFGTIQVGRAPLDWGLGVVWNAGNHLWDHYESTGDSIRLISKFGAFSFIPSFTSISTGNAVGGACFVVGSTGCNPTVGTGAVTNYSLILKYENPDEDFEGGVNFIKRIAGAAQDPNSGYLGPQGTPQGMNYNTFDIYGRKKLGKFTFAAEIPLTSGYVGSTPDPSNFLDYSTYAVALEANYKSSDTFETNLKAGHAPGQPNLVNPYLDRYRAFFFNPNYHIAMIMFNYQLRNFSGASTLNNPALGQQALVSPYDNPIVNANYVNIGEQIHTDKWTFNGALIYANATNSAAAGQYFFNYWDKRIAGPVGSPKVAVKDQSSNLGVEFDLGATFQYDENFQFGLDFGLYSPGAFYAFSNTGVDNATSLVFASTAKVGIAF